MRYAVVGLGHIAQAAILPGFARAKKNSVLAALVSGDSTKRRTLGTRHRVPTVGYDRYDELLTGGTVDAVFIALPNHLHEDYTVRAARHGVHVLCEKPMAMRSDECRRMIDACDAARVKLMIAYRLHFEDANLEAVRVARSGRLGRLRFFNAAFSRLVKEENYRLDGVAGGGPVYDLGVYCINAARYLFRSEPTEVMALSAIGGQRRYSETDEMTGAVLRFPGDRLAQFITSFGAADTSAYDLAGTNGTLRLDPAFEYVGKKSLIVTVNEKSRRQVYAPRDQFAAQIAYFSDCILSGRSPEPSGREGLTDVRIVEAILASARSRRPVRLHLPADRRRPGRRQAIRRPPARKAALVKTASANR